MQQRGTRASAALQQAYGKRIARERAAYMQEEKRLRAAHTEIQRGSMELHTRVDEIRLYASLRLKVHAQSYNSLCEDQEALKSSFMDTALHKDELVAETEAVKAQLQQKMGQLRSLLQSVDRVSG